MADAFHGLPLKPWPCVALPEQPGSLLSGFVGRQLEAPIRVKSHSGMSLDVQ